MEVYGSGYEDDVDYVNYNKRNTQTHTESMMDQLERIILCYDLCLFVIDTMSREAFLTKVPTYKRQF